MSGGFPPARTRPARSTPHPPPDSGGISGRSPPRPDIPPPDGGECDKIRPIHPAPRSSGGQHEREETPMKNPLQNLPVRAVRLALGALFASLAALTPSAAAQDPNGAIYESGEVCVEIDCQRHQAANHCGRPVNFAACHADASGGCLMNFFESLDTGQSKVFLCKEGKGGNIAACYKPFKPVSISPFEFRCFPDPNDPDAAQESARQAEAAKNAQSAQSAQAPASQPDNPTNCLIVQRDSQIVGTDFNGQPIDVGSNLLANNCNCDMNVTMSPENFVVPANQRVVVPTPGSAVYSYFACFAPQKPVFVGNGRYECRGKNPQSECRITGNFVETRGAAPAVQPQDSATAQGGQSDDSCKYANDGVCDDDDPGLCAPGTDATDCASRRGEKVAEAQAADNQPDDSCQHANDGECDDPGLCAPGTDATDCASRRGEEVAEAQNAEEDPLAALRGTPPPTGTKTEEALRGHDVWGGQLDVNARVKYGVVGIFAGDNISHLHVAVRESDTEAARWLIANGADVNAKDDDGETPFHGIWSAEIVKLLIANGADVNAKNDDGMTPLHRKAQFGSAAEIAKVLIDNGAEVNAKSKDGWTPLDWAIWGKRSAVQSLLRQHGGRCNKKC